MKTSFHRILNGHLEVFQVKIMKMSHRQNDKNFMARSVEYNQDQECDVK